MQREHFTFEETVIRIHTLYWVLNWLFLFVIDIEWNLCSTDDCDKTAVELGFHPWASGKRLSEDSVRNNNQKSKQC